jgi:radical SAM superfamily enzyme YgiQ (UPF0313 family)
LPVIDRVRAINPHARLCAYGLYAPLNGGLLSAHGVDHVIGGEFEDALVDFACEKDGASSPPKNGHDVPRVQFRVPDRRGLPPLSRYALLQVGPDQRRTGYTEASRGCKHRCRHCPIVPVYDGRFRVVPIDVVIADIRTQVAAGAEHVTFGDPDFFNGIGHARAILAAFGREFPGVSYDVTIKVEHLVAHRDTLPLLRDTGCAFVTTAVESLDDDVLGKLEKGHTRADFERVVEWFEAVGLVLSPTFVAFTPWTTRESFCELLQTLARLDLVDHVAPIQLAIRLLVTEGSRLLELDDLRAAIRPFDPVTLTYPWRHRDPQVDVLQERIARDVGVRHSAPRRETFARVWDMAHAAAGMNRPLSLDASLPRAAVPYLNEPWYC